MWRVYAGWMVRITSFVCGVLISALCMFTVQPDQIMPLDVAYSVRVSGNIDQPRHLDQGAQRAEDGLFYVDGHADGKTVKFLVDTGASYVVLSHFDAKKLGVTKLASAADSQLLTAAGPALTDWVRIAEIRIDGHLLKDVRAAVPHNDVGISLLGQNALAQFRSMHIKNDRLELTQ